jgi:hypothetical protein
MNRMTGMITGGLILLICAPRISAQQFEYRASLFEEASKNYINGNTPVNWNNSMVPQPSGESIASANLNCGFGIFSGSFGGTLSGNNLIKPQYSLAVREASVDLNLTDQIDLMIGKKILKWGTGYAFNPTGVVEPARLPSDPTDRLKLNDGRNVVSVTGLAGRSSFTFVYLNDFQIRNSNFYPDRSEIAARVYTYLNGLDLSAIAHYRAGDRLEAGINYSFVIGDNLEIHGEALGKRGTSQEYENPVISGDGIKFYNDYPYQALYYNSDKMFWKFLIGGQFTFDDGINIVLEYYHNDDGLSKAEWKRWLDFVRFHNNIQNGTYPVPRELLMPSKYNLLWSLKTLSPRGTMMDYIFVRIYYSESNWNFELLSMINGADLSVVLIPAFTFKFSENFSVYLRYSGFAGSGDSEYRNMFLKGSLTLGLGAQF